MTQKSSPIFGKNQRRECSSNCAGSLPSPFGTTANELILGRDRFGIAPLYWTRQGDWFIFASEIKSILASGMVPARPDRRGIDHIFTFSGLPGPITCFEGMQLLRPGHFCEITPGSEAAADAISTKAYWEMDFPDRGHEEQGE